MKRDTNEKGEEGKREERDIFLNVRQPPKLVMPSVRCCPAAPELIGTNFRDVRSHPVEEKKVRRTPAELAPNIRSSGN